MDIKYVDIFFVPVLFYLIHWVSSSELILSCDVGYLDICPELQFCSNTTKKCECIRGYTLVEDHCEIPVPRDTHHNGTVAVVTIFTVALIVCGLVLVIRHYNLLEYVRQKVNLRRNNDIMYEDVMIGQDDPPINP